MAQLYFYYSAMNAGKSTSLLQSAYNYRERGMTSVIFTAAIDDRYGKGKVSSRIGLSEEALLFNKGSDLRQMLQQQLEEGSVNCVLIDKCQFLTRTQIMQLSDIVDNLGIPVLCYGLRTDFQGELFEGSQYLLAWADKLIELKTICHCGRKAIMVVRMNGEGQVMTEGNQVEIGGNERYVSMCRKHYTQMMWQ